MEISAAENRIYQLETNIDSLTDQNNRLKKELKEMTEQSTHYFEMLSKTIDDCLKYKNEIEELERVLETIKEIIN